MACAQERPAARSCMGIVDEAGRLERAGFPVIHLEKGEVDLDTPDVVKEAAVQALRDNRTRYSHSSGLPELREAISAHYARVYGVEIDPGRVVVHSGSSAAMLELFLAVLEPGDEVVVPDPCYPAYPSFVEAARGRVVRAPSNRHGFLHTAELAAQHITPATRALLINYPSNPVGSVAGAAELRAFAELDRLIVSDEVYHGLAFGEDRPHTILEFTDNAVVIGSFSKAYLMTGWRLGYAIVPERLRTRLTRMHSYLFVGTNTFVQWAAVTALANAEPIQRELRAELLRRHDALAGALPRAGLRPVYPAEGGFYVLTTQPPDTGSSAEFAAGLLDATHVAITPGSEFGPAAEGCVRFSLSSPAGRIVEGLDRIADFLRGDRAGRAPRELVTHEGAAT